MTRTSNLEARLAALEASRHARHPLADPARHRLVTEKVRAMVAGAIAAGGGVFPGESRHEAFARIQGVTPAALAAWFRQRAAGIDAPFPEADLDAVPRNRRSWRSGRRI